MQVVPPPLLWRFSRRYIAGSRLDDAYAVVGRLNAQDRCSATIDVLGEDSVDREQVGDAQSLYLEALRGIQERGLDCGISVKLSEMGLRFDAAGCREVMRGLAGDARERGLYLRIDMEDSSVTSATLDVYRELRRGFDNVGIVIQSCLRRSERDVAGLIEEGIADVRLCKGIYVEPEDIAYRDPAGIDASYLRLLTRLVESDAARVGIATHDPRLVAAAEALIRRHALPKERYEFQMLLGVATRLRRELVARGHPLRVYVPFGERWHAYSMRRLRENPQILGHVVRNLFTPGEPQRERARGNPIHREGNA